MKSQRHIRTCIPLVAALLAASIPGAAVAAEELVPLDRTMLPIQAPKPPVYTELDVRKATAPPRFEVKAPDGRAQRADRPARRSRLRRHQRLRRPGRHAHLRPPGHRGPALQQLPHHRRLLADPRRAQERAQPPRQQHGRDHRDRHGLPRQHRPDSQRGRPARRDAAPERLRTAAFGKWHETAAWEASMAGPFDRWPTRQGFDKFYGFLGGETNQWAPFIYDGTHPVELPDDPNYHFHDRHDRPGRRLDQVPEGADARTSRSSSTSRPAPPMRRTMCPQEWIARWKGKFDQGWDKLREEILARQIERGIVPKGTKLAPKPEAIPDWDTLTRRREDAVHPPGRGVRRLRRDDRPRDRPGDRGHRGHRPTRQHAGLPRLRRQRHQRRGRPQRHVQRDDLLQRRAGTRSPTCSRTSTSGAAPKPTRTWPPAGRWRSTRPTSGPSRSAPITAAPRSAWPSTGPRASRPRANCAPSSTT